MPFFFFQFVFMVNYTDRFLYFEPSQLHWDEGYLIIVDDFCDIFLDVVCKYFVVDFCTDVHEGD